MEFLYFINNSKWLQDLVPTPILLDPVTLGWRQLEDGHYVPEVSKVLAAPEAMVELVKCSCVANKCSGRCSCKAHNLVSAELCKCEGAEDTCNNVAIDQNSSDDRKTRTWMTGGHLEFLQLFMNKKIGNSFFLCSL